MFRGFLIALILIPVIYLVEKEKTLLLLNITHERNLLKASRQQNAFLEKMVAERTHFLEQTLLTLESSQKELGKQLYIQSRLIASVTHDISSPLQYVSVIADEVDGLVQKEEYKNLALFTSNLRSSTQNLSVFMKNLLDFIRVNVHDREVKFESVNLHSIIHEKTTFYHSMMELKNNSVISHIDPNLFVHSNRTLLSIMIHNLIDNANKFSSEAGIEIGTMMHEERLELYVINHTVNNFFPHQVNTEEIQPTSGIGLVITKEIANLLSIDFSILHSEQFTKATITFPMHFRGNANKYT